MADKKPLINSPIQFTDQELGLIEDTSFFETKALITQKVKTLLHLLHDTLKKELVDFPFLAPDDFHLDNHQFVKGEHLSGFPYLYLDYPKYYTKQEMFSFRSLFWWGHHFIFAWILSGKYLDQYKENILRHYKSLSGKGLFILMTKDPWEWKKHPDNLLEIRQDNQEEVSIALKTRPFLKIHRYIDFRSPAILKGTPIEEAIQALRSTFPIIVRPT